MKKETERENFISVLELEEHDIMKVIEKRTLESLRDTFEGENTQTHYILKIRKRKVLGMKLIL